MNPPLQLPIRTDRLLLRPYAADDLPALHAIYARDDVVRYLYDTPHTLEQTRALLERVRPLTGIDVDVPGADALRVGVFLATADGAGPLIGDFSLWRTNRDHAQGEIGFVLHPAHQGRGYGREGMRELLRIGFERGGLHRIEARCDARNAASARLMERLGMRREGRLIENELVKGEWTDELVYAILDREWRAA